jgi:hypothetical protein
MFKIIARRGSRNGTYFTTQSHKERPFWERDLRFRPRLDSTGLKSSDDWHDWQYDHVVLDCLDTGDLFRSHPRGFFLCLSVDNALQFNCATLDRRIQNGVLAPLLRCELRHDLLPDHRIACRRRSNLGRAHARTRSKNYAYQNWKAHLSGALRPDCGLARLWEGPGRAARCPD